MGLSLRFKIIFITVAILVLAIGATVIASSYIFAQEYTDVLQSRTVIIGQSIKSQLDRLLGLGIPLQELTGFEQQLQDTVNTYGDIAYVMIIDLDGRVLFHNDPLQQNITITDAATLKAAQSGAEVIQTYSDQNGEFQDVFIPILDRGGDHVGAIRLGFPTNLITARINRLAILSGVIAIVSLVVAITLLIFTLSAWVTRPLAKLLTAIQLIRSGEQGLSTRVEINSRDELGELSAAFNMMATQLNDLIETLEQQVAERTQGVETVAALSEKLVAILNLEQLLQELVNQIQNVFGYYHAHVYLIDNHRQNLVVSAGTGAAGAQMKAQGHSIPLSALTSLVARAARSGQVVRADNVRETPDWLPNPLLPDTYSEMAVPIVVDGQVAGVLDVQQNKLAGLDEGDENLLRSLANQVAVAVRNARLFAQVQQALTEAREAQERYLRGAWTKTQHQQARHIYRRPDVAPPSAQTRNSLKQQAISQTTIISTRVADGDTPNSAGAHPALASPVKVSGQAIGALQLHRANGEQDWSPEDLALVEAVLDQVAQTAENLRLFEETQNRADYEQLVGEITQKIRQAPTLEILTKTASQELSKVLGVSYGLVRIGVTPQEKQGSQSNGPS
jgi:GAF domain-containing protein/HAMP domain-containing protein